MNNVLQKTSPFAIVCVVAIASLVTTGCADKPEQRSTSATDTLTVLAYNIHHGEGMDEVLDLERIAALIRSVDADVVTVQEVDSVAARTNMVDQAKELGRLTGMTPLFGSFMPYDGGAYGMAMLSRWEIVESVNYRLPDGDEPRTALTAVVASPRTGKHVRVVGIHFYRTEEERLAQAKSLEGQLPDDLPTILAGDFNSEPGTAVINHLSTTWELVEKGEDHLTFSSFAPEKEIDFVFSRPRGYFNVAREWLLDEPVASDHRPVAVTFTFGDSE